jgi:sortase A
MKHAQIWLAAALVLLSSLACRVEIGTGQAAAVAAPIQAGVDSQSAGRQPAGTAGAATSPATGGEKANSPTPDASTPTPTATPLPPVPTPTPTFTPTPIVPAQTPPDHIRAQAIGLDAPVVPAGWKVVEHDGNQTSVWEVPLNAAGWHQNSALPGQGGNVVLSGHHNMGAEVFRHVVDLKPGDEVILHADGRDYGYVVKDRFILPERGVPEEQREQNAQWIMPTASEQLTLVTCWPYTGNSHRVIVVAEPVR